MSFPLEPLENLVVVRVIEVKEKTNSGIFLPGTNESKPEEGEVLAVGEKVNTKITVGSHVVFSKYAPTNVMVGGEPYLLLRDEDILALITN